jgi:hypothetical protein
MAQCCPVVRHGLKKEEMLVFLGQIDEEALQQLKTELRDRHNSTRQVGDERFGVNGQPIHMRSISFQYVASFGPYSLHLVLPLTAEHKRQRLDWCRTREHWDIESTIIVFSDESRFRSAKG